MRPPSRYIGPLSAQEAELLRELLRNSPSHRTRVRAHAILLSSKGYPISTLMEIFEVSRLTITSWLERYSDKGPDGLDDESRSGRPKKLDESKRDALFKAASENPQDPFSGFDWDVSKDTFRRVLKSLGFCWKRLCLSLSNQRDEESFRSAQQELNKLIAAAKLGCCDVFFFDEAGFCLNPVVPYGWQPKGKTIGLDAGPSHSKRINVLGFLHHSGKRLSAWTIDQSVTSDVVADSLRDFSLHRKPNSKPCIVIIDNATMHHSQEVQEAISDLQERKDIFFQFIPPRSPELNWIEILWRKIKYQWLPNSAFASIESLETQLHEIIAYFGTKYQITFA